MLLSLDDMVALGSLAISHPHDHGPGHPNDMATVVHVAAASSCLEVQERVEEEVLMELQEEVQKEAQEEIQEEVLTVSN